MKQFFFIGAVIVSLYFFWRESEIPRPTGVLAPDDLIRGSCTLTRSDTGGGACELILVESLYVW